MAPATLFPTYVHPLNQRDAFRVNNFDLIRLFAASIVALRHALDQFHMEHNPVYHFTTWVPGVPIFFIVSGFLISKSYENNPKLGEFALNRALRLYPALLVCTLLGLAVVFGTGYMATQSWTFTSLSLWLLGQVTVVQFYNPDFMREYGSGVLNGALWTVTVELQFYCLTPILYWGINKLSRIGLNFNFALCLLVIAFAGVNLGYKQLLESQPDAITTKLVMVTFLPWVFMYLLGVLAQRNFDRLRKLVVGWRPALTIAAVYAVCIALSYSYFHWDIGNDIHPVVVIPLTGLILVAAYNAPNLARNLLRHCDFSYGVYIYHMPVINLMIYLWHPHSVWAVAAAVVATATLGVLSWFLIERPAMRLKKNPLINWNARAGAARG